MPLKHYNITHWSFLDDNGIDVERLCSKLLLIADMDSGKEERHVKLEEALGDRFLRLNVLEVENLLSPEVVESVIREYEGEDARLNAFCQDDYRKCKLGTFIDDQVLRSKEQSRRYAASAAASSTTPTAFEGQSGSVKNKVDFCDKALGHLSLNS